MSIQSENRMDVVARKVFHHAAPTVWALLADFGNTEWLAPFFVRHETHGEGVGMTRMLFQTLDGTPAIHRLVDLNHETRVLTWSIHQTVFIPVDTIDAVTEVRAIDDYHCEVISIWSYTPPENANQDELYTVTESWMVGAMEVMEVYLDKNVQT